MEYTFDILSFSHLNFTTSYCKDKCLFKNKKIIQRNFSSKVLVCFKFQTEENLF